MIHLMKTSTGTYPAFQADSPLYDVPFTSGWRRIGTYDCPQLCTGCGMLTHLVYQGIGLYSFIACNTACVQVALQERTRRGQQHSPYLSIFMHDHAAVKARLVSRVKESLAHPPPLDVALHTTSQARLQKRYGQQAICLDVTSHGTYPWCRASPLWPHGTIPVPFSPTYTSQSVEGVWQGLKVFQDGRDVDTSRFAITTMRGLKRRGRVLGHREGVDGQRLLSYIDARRTIYLPTYQWLIEHALREEIGSLIRLRARGRSIVLLDYTTNGDIEDEHSPLSHAMLLKHFIDTRWTLAGIRSYLPHVFEDGAGEDDDAPT